ncbi:uncharacterized protein LOC144927138 [Branchiostoma floridae x Branchiostoma belcheri]
MAVPQHQTPAAVPWEDFVHTNLLQYGAVTGVALFGCHGNLVYSQGCLSDGRDRELWGQVKDLFTKLPPEEDRQVNRVLTIPMGQRSADFRIYQMTENSAYGTTERQRHGVVVCHLPLGILVALHEERFPASKAVSVVENFCGLLRA